MSDLTALAPSEIAAAVAEYYSTGAIKIGTGSTAFDPAQTDLLGASTETLVIDSVTVDGAEVTFSAQAGFADANFNWAEFGVFSPGGTMLARRVTSAAGTKTDSAEWVAEVVLTFALPA